MTVDQEDIGELQIQPKTIYIKVGDSMVCYVNRGMVRKKCEKIFIAEGVVSLILFIVAALFL